MGKGNVKTYVLNDNGNYDLYDKKNEELEKVNYISPEDLPKEIDKALHTNPFLLISNKNITENISLIEEFYVTYKNENITLDNLIRDDSIKKRVKKQTIKRNFKNWKKESIDFLSSKSKMCKENYDKTHPERYKQIKPLNLFFLIVSLILSLIIIFEVFSFIVKNKLSLVISIVTIVVTTISIVLVIIQNCKNNNYDKLVEEYFDKQKKIIKKCYKHIKKQYRKLKKYYSKGYINNLFKKAPYKLKNVYVDMDVINSLDKYSNDIIENYKKIEKENRRLSIYYHFPLVSSYFLVTLNGGFIIIMLLIKLFNLIFMKGE